MIEALQPAQITNMDHTTNSRRQFNKHSVRSDVFHQAFVATSLWEFLINLAPWIRRKLLNRQAHLPALFIERYNLCFMNISKLEEFLCVYRCICPGDLTNVNQSFNSRLNFKERTVVFDIDNLSF